MTRTPQDLLMECRYCCIEADRSKDPVARATLLAHRDVLLAQVETHRRRVFAIGKLGPAFSIMRGGQ